MSTEIETFDARNLVSLSPFSVIWTATRKTQKTRRDGGLYDKKIVVVESAKLSEPMNIEMSQQDYEKLRILSLTGISTFSVTEGVENTKGYRPMIFAGAAVFHEGGVKA